jgi:heptosyltransferase-1
MRILIVKLSSFGDVIHTLPALSDLAAARPGIEVDWLVEKAFAAIAVLHPAVHAVHPVEYRRLRWPPAHWPLLAGSLAALRRRLRARKYDLVVDLQGLMKSALLARLAGAPVAGYDRDSAREPVASRFYAKQIGVGKNMHAVERTRRLLAAAVGYPVPDGPGRFGLAKRGRALGIPGLPAHYGVVVHSASWPTKLWREDRWQRLIREATASGEGIVLPWGNAEERARAERLAEGTGAMVLPRILPGDELSDLVGGARFAVGLDSGLMHLVSAFGVPGVWLYGPTDPALTGPYGDNQTIVRSDYPEAPCLRRRCDRTPGGTCCMDAIAHAGVAAAVSGLRR